MNWFLISFWSSGVDHFFNLFAADSGVWANLIKLEAIAFKFPIPVPDTSNISLSWLANELGSDFVVNKIELFGINNFVGSEKFPS